MGIGQSLRTSEAVAPCSICWIISRLTARRWSIVTTSDIIMIVMPPVFPSCLLQDRCADRVVCAFLHDLLDLVRCCIDRVSGHLLSLLMENETTRLSGAQTEGRISLSMSKRHISQKPCFCPGGIVMGGALLLLVAHLCLCADGPASTSCPLGGA